MKKIILLALTITGFTLSSKADIIYPDGSKPDGGTTGSESYVIKKLSRGIANIITCGFEIPKAIWETTSDEVSTSMAPYSLGLATRGPYRALRRLSSGLYDLGTVFENGKPLLHLESEYLGIGDLLPGYNTQFDWETINTPAHHQ